MPNKELENFTDWDEYYAKTKVEVMPWYEKNLDHDLENELNQIITMWGIS